MQYEYLISERNMSASSELENSLVKLFLSTKLIFAASILAIIYLRKSLLLERDGFRSHPHHGSSSIPSNFAYFAGESNQYLFFNFGCGTRSDHCNGPSTTQKPIHNKQPEN
jgi:hypothetical protein